MEWQDIHQIYALPNPTIPIDHDANSWYRHNCDTIFENPIEIQDNASINSRKIHLRPTAKQANKMLIWHKIYNQIYNIALSTFNRLGRVSTRMSLRNIVKRNLTDNMKRKIKSCGIPAHTVSYAIFDVINAYNAARAKGGAFRLRRKKSINGSMAIELSSIKKTGIAVRALGPMAAQPGFSFESVKMGCRLKKENTGFYLYVPYKVNKKRFDTDLVCGLDPGIRTFQTAYQPNGAVYDICTNYEARIRPILERIDRIADIPEARRCKLRLYEKIKHLTEDMHWKTIKWLTSKYRKIHIGKISTSGIVRQEDFNRMQKRLMLAQSHFTFRMRLKAKCAEYNVDFVEVNEHHTSVTCGNCRARHQNLGGNKVYDCVNCGYHADRDANAARNILIRGVTNRQD